MKCAACGRKNSQDAGFCGGCGAKTTAPVLPAAALEAGKAKTGGFDLEGGNAAPRPAPANHRFDLEADKPPAPAKAAPPGQTKAPSALLFLVCVGGPDAGKRMAVGEQEITLSRSVQCGLLSDDPDVGQQQAARSARNGQI